MTEQKMIPAKVEKREPAQHEYRFTVVVKTDTAEHAQQVIEERTGYEEEYEDDLGRKFDYGLWVAEERELTSREQEDIEIRRMDEGLAEDEPNPVGDAPNDVLFFPKGGQ